jgi:cytochrome c6
MLSILNRLPIFYLFFLLLGSCNIKKVDENMPSIHTGKEIFEQRCISCHGFDGKLGLSGAKNLTTSSLPIEEVKFQITNGKGAMAPFKHLLSPEEISIVSEFAISLRKK